MEPDEMLEDEFHDVEIRSGKPLEQFSELQHLDGTIVDHWKKTIIHVIWKKITTIRTLYGTGWVDYFRVNLLL